jgi:hypothetical protein
VATKNEIFEFFIISATAQDKKGIKKTGLTSSPVKFSKRLLKLLTETESLDDSTVASDVLTLKIHKQTTTTTYQCNKRSVSAIIFVIGLHVFGQMANTV